MVSPARNNLGQRGQQQALAVCGLIWSWRVLEFRGKLIKGAGETEDEAERGGCRRPQHTEREEEA